MNILVIGNGFDLAHGLPTKYSDFLKMVESFRSITNAHHIMTTGGLNNIEKSIYAFLDRFIFEESVLKDEFNKLIENNFWIEYFLQCHMYRKENWIDFESEISNVIQSIDYDIKKSKRKLDDDAYVVSNFYLERFFHKRLPTTVLDFGQDIQVITYREIRDVLYHDLEKLIRAFEIYLCEYVGKIKCDKISKEIKSLEIDHVLSFNYSDTYQKLYDKTKDIKYDYIHGQSRCNSTKESNNMVLGIDEYLHKKSKDKDIDFIAFKKYYQRIYKETGCEYKNWVDEIVNSRYADEALLREQFPKQIPYEKFNSKHKLYIFGHSLDITDKDVLRSLILNDNVYTTIYYLNKAVMGQQIANLVKVIGQDELIRRTGGSTKTIEFKLQAEFVKIEK